MTVRYDAMMVMEYESHGEKKSRWTKIGAGFVNRDGSIGIQLDAYPTTGKIILQVPLTKEEREAKFGGQGQGSQQRQGGGGMQRRAKSHPQQVAYTPPAGTEFNADDDDLPFPE